MERFVKSLLIEFQTINEEEKRNKIRELREVSGQSQLIHLLESDEKKGLELIRGLISWLPQEIEGAHFVLDILNELDECPRILEVVLMGWDFLYSVTKKLLANLDIQIVEFTCRERVDISQNLIDDLLFLVRNNMFETLFLDEFEFCVDSMIGICVDSSDVNESIMYMQLLEIIYRLPKEKTTAGLFVSFIDNKLAVIASLCPVFVWEEHRWVLKISSDFRKDLIGAYISWLSPRDIEGALILLDILKEPLKTCDVYVMARNFFLSLGKNLLGDLRKQAIEITSGKRISFSEKLINGLLVLVRNDTFEVIYDAVQTRAESDEYHGVLLLPEGLIESNPEVYALLQVKSNAVRQNERLAVPKLLCSVELYRSKSNTQLYQICSKAKFYQHLYNSSPKRLRPIKVSSL